MKTYSHQHLDPAGAWDQTYLESLIREDFERCHPGETLDDLKRRASFSREDRGLLRDWMTAGRAAATNVGWIEGSETHNDPGSSR
jgi:hypothetical protein